MATNIWIFFYTGRCQAGRHPRHRPEQAAPRWGHHVRASLVRWATNRDLFWFVHRLSIKITTFNCRSSAHVRSVAQQTWCRVSVRSWRHAEVPGWQQPGLRCQESRGRHIFGIKSGPIHLFLSFRILLTWQNCFDIVIHSGMVAQIQCQTLLTYNTGAIFWAFRSKCTVLVQSHISEAVCPIWLKFSL